MQLLTKREFPSVDAFGFTTLSAGAAAIGAVIASGLYKSWFVPIALMLYLVTFQIVFLAVWLLFRPIRPFTSRWGPWLFIPVTAGALGFALPFAIGLLVGLFPIPGAIGGAVGGLAGAWAWLYAERNPGALRTEPSLRQRLSPAALVIAALGIIAVVLSLAKVVGIW